MEGFYTGKAVYHTELGPGRVVRIDEETRRVTVNFGQTGPRTFSVEDAADELTDPPEREHREESHRTEDLDIRDAMKEALMELGLVGVTPIGDRWEGGEMLLRPGREGLQEKSVPIDTFFHKIVMVRNQLRMLEQSVNASTSLTDAEKVDLQQYVTRCYGSLTTFNVLFSDKADWFVGSKKR